MKFKINLQIKPQLLKLTKLAASCGALFTMVFSPVAMGREAERITVKQLQSAVDEAGLNKQHTVGEFYEKNKHLIPPRLQKEFQSFIEANKNQMMPNFEVIAQKGTDGVDVASLRLTQGNEVVTVQMLGETDRYAKIQNTYLTEVDIINFNDMFKRILAGDEKYRKQYENLVNLSKAPKKVGYTGFPDLTVAAWKKMSQKERAAYMINMRLLWNDARRVLIEAERKDKKGRKTSSIDSAIEKWDAFLSLINPPAEANEPRPRAVPVKPAKALGGTPDSVKAGAGSTAFVSGSNCIVAGYVSTYSSSRCGADLKSSEGILKSYKNPQSIELINSTNSFCTTNKGATFIACNPFVYGTPGGSPICVDTTISSGPLNFQKATHFDGPCENTPGQASKLGNDTPFLKEDKKDASRYDDENRLLSDEQLKEEYKKQQADNPKMVEDYLNGLLAYKKKAGIDFRQPLTEEMLGEIRAIKEAFDNDIQTARESCKLAVKNKNNEKNFWGACDQLHRRFLNVAQFLKKSPGCEGEINESNLKCVCPSGPEVLPGTKCGSQQPPPSCPVNPPPEKQDCVPPLPGEDTQAKCNKADYPGAESEIDDNCKCLVGGGLPTVAAETSGGEVKHFSCSGGEKEKEEKECGILCKIKKGAKAAFGWVKNNFGIIAFSGLAAFVLYKILNKKKPDRKSAGDFCPGSTSKPPCAQTCAYPLALQTNGSCACAACPPGQTLANESTCTCSTGSTTTELTCWDGVTKVTDLANCPEQTFPCWDGSTVTNPLNCPEQPSSTNKSRSSSGKVKK